MATITRNEGKPVCKLIGENGNVFAIIGAVEKALKNAGMRQEANDFVSRAFASGSYREVLRQATQFVEIE